MLASWVGVGPHVGSRRGWGDDRNKLRHPSTSNGEWMRQLVGVLGERGAPQANPEHGDAFRRMFVIRAIVWLQQSRTMHDVQARDYDAGLSADRAIGRLADARTAGLHTDPLDREALALRGYVAKTLAGPAQVLPGGGAVFRARLFEHVVQLEPGYTAAHHDLALTFETKMQADPAHADEWCQWALQAWQRAYELAPDDPSFSADAVLAIGQRVSRLKRECGQAGP